MTTMASTTAVTAEVITMTTTDASRPRRAHTAHHAKIVTAGLSSSAVLGIVAFLGHAQHVTDVAAANRAAQAQAAQRAVEQIRVAVTTTVPIGAATPVVLPPVVEALPTPTSTTAVAPDPAPQVINVAVPAVPPPAAQPARSKSGGSSSATSKPSG